MGTPGGASISTARSENRDEGDRLFDFGKYKGRSFRSVYDNEPSYVNWTLDEMQKGEGYCKGMRRWQEYINVKRAEEESNPPRTPTAYMVVDVEEIDENDDVAMWVNTEDEEATYMFLDSGCNQTCHGELWMKRFSNVTKHHPQWLHRQTTELNGIGGRSRTLGERLLYVMLENNNGEGVPGEVTSMEIEGSKAPMLLSLPSQEALGLVVDFEDSTIYSKLLNMTFKAVRGKRNRLLGLKITPAEFAEMNVAPVETVALMAESSEGSDKKPPWRTSDEGDQRGVPKARAAPSEMLTRIAPDGQRYTSEVRVVPTRAASSSARPSEENTDKEDDDVWVEVEEEEASQPAGTTQNETWDRDETDDAPLEEQILDEPEEEGQPEGELSPKEKDVFRPEDEETDWWDIQDNEIIRHHVQPRTMPFYPTGSRMDLPVDLMRLAGRRVTYKLFEDGNTETVNDNWKDRLPGQYVKERSEATTFEKAPPGLHVVRRITYNMENGEEIADETEYDLMQEGREERLLPNGVTYIRTRFHVFEDFEDESPWIGTTTFRLKPLETELADYVMDPKDTKRTMTKGQRKQLEQEVENLEEKDMALWSVLTRRKAFLPMRWKIVFELFCGCALLTRMFQAAGYETCTPLDMNNGWNVFDPKHRRWAEDMLDRENPYLLTVAWPCGPWSPWQRMAKDQEIVQEKRKKWLPILGWIKKMVRKQQQKGGVTMVENPWPSEAWNTQEIMSPSSHQYGRSEEEQFEVLRVDACAFGLRDYDSKLLHKKPTGIGTDSPGIKTMMRGMTCSGDHEHEPLEGNNSRGARTRQAAKWTSRMCRRIIRGVQIDLENAVSTAFAGEAMQEAMEEEPHALDEIYGEEDLPSAKPTAKEAEVDLAREEALEDQERLEEPEAEKIRRRMWTKLSRKERIGIRRLHVMTSHATRPQMQRMLRYSNAPANVVSAVKYFKCSACERLSEGHHPAVVKAPNPYTFAEDVGLDVFEVKDAEGNRYQVLHAVCHGTTFQAGEVLGISAGVPSSRLCLDLFTRFWMSWAGTPKSITVDRGTHNRGVFFSELQKLGVEVRSAATQAPFQIGRTERHGGILKHMINKVVMATQATGQSEMQLVLMQCLETKNRQANIGGFSPSQWVLGRNPRAGGWTDEDEETVVVHDEDPQSTFNRRNVMREAARIAWAEEDSRRRVQKALLRKGGGEAQQFRQGDLVAFMRRKQGAVKWYGPGRVLTQEGKNVWIMHGGVPILTSETMVRAATSEEYLTKELIGVTKGKKRGRGLLYEDPAQHHQLGSTGQPSYLDLRKVEDDEDAAGAALPRGGLGNIAPTERGGDEDESPKRMRALIRDEEKKQEDEARSMASRTSPHEVPVPTSPTNWEDNSPGYSPGTPVEEQATSSTRTVQTPSLPQPPAVLTPLSKAMAIAGGNQLDVGAKMAKSMRTQREETKEESAAERTMNRPRSRSPPEALKKEFTSFMAKRYNKKGGDPKSTGELRYERETKEMQRQLDITRGKEWTNWVKYKATRVPSKKEVEQMLMAGIKPVPMRWVDVDKHARLRVEGGPEVEPKLKSRLVLRGDLEEGDFRVDCPTATATGTHLVISFAACTRRRLRAGDISAAFLQGSPINRELLMKVPNTGIPGPDGQGYAVEPGSYLVALMSIYGSKDAPRGFWIALRDEMQVQGLREVEPALYALTGDQGELHGLAATHVDDIIWTGDETMDSVMDKIQERFTFGSIEEENFRFCGRRIESKDDYYEVTCPELLSKVKPIHIEGRRDRSPADPASAEEQSQMRAVLGSIGYVARLCRPELSYRCSALQGKQARPQHQDLVNTNKFLSAAQRTTGNGLRYVKNKIDFHSAVLLSVTDASFGAEEHTAEDGRKSGHRSQAGRFLLLADRMPTLSTPANVHILEWQSHTIRRVCRSTLHAEVMSSIGGSEAGQYVRALLYNMTNPKKTGLREQLDWKVAASDSRTIHWLTDCRSYVDTMSSTGQGVVADKRLAIDLTALRQDLWRAPGTECGEPNVQESIPSDCTDQLWWISTKDMISDGLTKHMLWDAMTKLCSTGQFNLTTAPRRAICSSGSGPVKIDGCEDVHDSTPAP